MNSKGEILKITNHIIECEIDFNERCKRVGHLSNCPLCDSPPIYSFCHWGQAIIQCSKLSHYDLPKDHKYYGYGNFTASSEKTFFETDRLWEANVAKQLVKMKGE